MHGYVNNIERLTLENTDFRQVLFTSEYMQLVLMCLQPEEDIGEEVHATTDQFFRVEAGTGKVLMNDKEYPLEDGDSIVVPAGTTHNVINTSSKNLLQLYTIYSPPHHRDKVIHHTKEEAEADTSDHL